MSIRKKKFSYWYSLQNDEIWKSKSERRNAIFPLEVMWPEWNKQQILGWKWCSQEPKAYITSPSKHFIFFLFFPPLFQKLLAWGKRYIFASQLYSSSGAHWSGFFFLPCLGCSRRLTGCRRWRWPWWQHWSDQRWAQSQTMPWRCFWTDASLLPSWSAAILLPPQSQPGNIQQLSHKFHYLP